MPFKPKAREARRSEALLVSVTPRVRSRVEEVARKERVSLAEVGRRALESFLRDSSPSQEEG